eukprot:Hpha_TRINITY_DN9399_c0_g2::TRINITY_DN9399_c0_g2_i1::g.25858::m.25858
MDPVHAFTASALGSPPTMLSIGSGKEVIPATFVPQTLAFSKADPIADLEPQSSLCIEGDTEPLTTAVLNCFHELADLSNVLKECAPGGPDETEGLISGAGGEEKEVKDWALRVGGRAASNGVRKIASVIQSKLEELKKAVSEQVVEMYAAYQGSRDAAFCAPEPTATEQRFSDAMKYSSDKFDMVAAQAKDSFKRATGQIGTMGASSHSEPRRRRSSVRPLEFVGLGKADVTQSVDETASPGAMSGSRGPAQKRMWSPYNRPVDTDEVLSQQLGAALHFALASLAAGVACERASVWLSQEREDRGEPKTVLCCASLFPAPNATQRDPRDFDLVSGQGVAGAVFSTGVALNVANTKHTSLWDAEESRKAGYDVKALMCFPVWSLGVGVGRQQIGIVQMLNKIPPATKFTAEDERTALHLAAGISNIVARFPVKYFLKRHNYSSLESVCLIPQRGGGAEVGQERRGSELEALSQSVGGELLNKIADTRHPQRIYRTGVRPVHITAKETLTAEAVITDGSNLSDLSQHISWMESMWRHSLDENAVMKQECVWWQGKCAEAQARMRWMEKQHERALRAHDLDRAKAALKALPQEPVERAGVTSGGNPGSRPVFSRVRAYGNEEQVSQQELVYQHERRWATFLGAPFEDKETQTVRSGGGGGGGSRRPTYGGGLWESVQRTMSLRRGRDGSFAVGSNFGSFHGRSPRAPGGPGLSPFSALAAHRQSVGSGSDTPFRPKPRPNLLNPSAISPMTRPSIFPVSPKRHVSPPSGPKAPAGPQPHPPKTSPSKRKPASARPKSHPDPVRAHHERGGVQYPQLRIKQAETPRTDGGEGDVRARIDTEPKLARPRTGGTAGSGGSGKGGGGAKGQTVSLNP